jgi:D-aminoacyl-tRNA deacylase
MRALVQRVSQAKVKVGGVVTGEIGPGLLIFLGVAKTDTERHAAFLARKISQLRIFPDGEGKMNLSLLQTTGAALIVSQFTLYGDTAKGNRPSYSEAAAPEIAKILYEFFIERCREAGLTVAAGIFQAHMEVSLINDGPVTLMCHSEG